MINESGIYHYKWDNSVVRLSYPRMCDQGDVWYSWEKYLGNNKWQQNKSYLTLDPGIAPEHQLIKIDDFSYAELLFTYEQ